MSKPITEWLDDCCAVCQECGWEDFPDTAKDGRCPHCGAMIVLPVLPIEEKDKPNTSMPKDPLTLELKFERCICFAQTYHVPCLLTAGSGDKPDFSQLRLSGTVRKDEWSAPVYELMEDD